jgi:para-nitrobenzyl esterase
MRTLFAAALIVATVPAAALAEAAPAAAPAATALSVESTDLGTLLDDPAAKAILTKHVPDLVGNGQIEMARSMTLKQLQQFAGDMLSDAKLAEIQADLDKLPKH